MKKQYGEKINKVKELIYETDGNCSIADLLEVTEDRNERELKQRLHKYKKSKAITFDQSYKNFKVLKDTASYERFVKERESKELYEWKQTEYLKQYLDGRELVTTKALKTSDIVKQNDINFKILARIEDSSVLSLLHELQGGV